MGQEPWDSSLEKAKTLTIADFGTPDEVREMAKHIRNAKNRHEATEILKNIIKTTPVLTNKTGTNARITAKSIGKLVSSEAEQASFNKEVHYLAVVNLDKLFFNSIEPWKFAFNPNKNNQGLKERKFLFAPLEYQGKIIAVKFTVKSYQDETLLDKIYSIEAMDVFYE